MNSASSFSAISRKNNYCGGIIIKTTQNHALKYLLSIIFLSVIFSRGEPAIAGNAYTFPYKLSLQTDIPLLAAGTCLESISLYHLKYLHNEPDESEIRSLDRKEVNSIERRFTKNYSKKADRASDITRDISLFSAGLTVVKPAINREWCNIFTLGIMYLEVFTIQQGSTGIVKSSANRMRPFMYNDEVSYEIKKNAAKDEDANRSFYSGHSSTAFSSVVFCAKVFDDMHPGSVYTPYIWGCGLALASATAYLRVEAGMHYPSDVLAGAIVGSIIGYVVPWLHYNKSEMISVIPVTGGMTGMGVIIKF